VADITLATADDLQFDLDDPGYGFDLGPSDGIGSQDYDLDLGLDFGDGPSSAHGNDDMSIEQGRDAVASTHSLDSHILGRGGGDRDLDLLSNRSRGASENPFGTEMDMDFGPDFAGMDLDLGVNFGDNLDREKTPGQTRSPSRACESFFRCIFLHGRHANHYVIASPLTPPPATPPPEGDLPTVKAKRKYKEKKQIIDSVTELKDGPGAKVGHGRDAGLGAPMTKDVSNILTEQHFLPRSPVVMRLLEIREDPLAHFLPMKVTPNGSFLCVAPPGLAPELTDMFLRPVQQTLAGKRRGHSPDKGANKKARLDGDDDEIEIARRAASLGPSVLGSDVLGRRSAAPDGDLDFGEHAGMIMDDFQMDLGGNFEMGQDELDLEGVRAKSATATDRSRMSTPGVDVVPIEEGEENYADATCPIAIFDVKPLTQTQGTEIDAEPVGGESKGYSKNTIKALGIIRRELKPAIGDEEAGAKVMSFRAMSDRVSFFFFPLSSRR